MSNFKGHMTSGIILSTGCSIFSHYLIPGSEIITFSCTLFGSLFPDTDTASKSRKIIYWLFFIISLILIYFKMYLFSSLLGIFAMLPSLSHHRGWTHSFIGMIFISLVISFVIFQIFPHLFLISFIFTILGFLLHLFLDKFF